MAGRKTKSRVGRRMGSSFTFHPIAAAPRRFGRFGQAEDSLRKLRNMALSRPSNRQTADIFTSPGKTSRESGGCQLAAVRRFEYSPILLNLIGETGLCRRG